MKYIYELQENELNYKDEFKPDKNIKVFVSNEKTKKIGNVDVILAPTSMDKVYMGRVMDKEKKIKDFIKMLTGSQKNKYLGKVKLANLELIDWVGGQKRFTFLLHINK